MRIQEQKKALAGVHTNEPALPYMKWIVGIY